MTALRALKDGRGVFIVGARGSGRTTLVRAALAALGEQERTRVWVGDGLEEFNDTRADRLARAIANGSVLPLATVTAHAPLARSLEALWKDGRVVRIELPPHTALELLTIAEQYVGGVIDVEAVARIIPSRGGSDLVALRLALDEARRSGSLVLSETGRPSQAPPDAWHPSADLHHILLNRLRPSGDNVPLSDTLVDVIALDPGIALSSLMELAGSLHPGGAVELELEALEDAGAVELLGSDLDPRVRLRDGLLELLIPTSLGVMRRRRITAVLVDTLLGAATALQPAELVVLAKHSLALGRQLPGDLLIRAARAALRSPDIALSLQIATAAVESGGGFDAETILAAAEMQAGRGEAARDRLNRIAESAADDLQRGEVLSGLLWYAVDRPAEASNLFASALRPDSPLAKARRGFLLFPLNDVVGAADLLRSALDLLSGEELAQAHYIIGIAAMFTGHFDEARNRMDAAEQILTELGSDTSRVQHVRAHLYQWEGRVTDGIELVRSFKEAAGSFGQWDAQALCGWTIGGLLIASGRVSEAVTELCASIEAMQRIGRSRSALIVRTDLAIALAQRGEEAAAIAALAPAKDGLVASVGLAGKVHQAEGWIHISSGRPTEAAASFRLAVEEFDATGYVMASLSMLLEAARAGDATALLPEIDELAGQVEGDHFGLLVRNAHAVSRFELFEKEQQADGRELATLFDDIGSIAAGIDLHLLAAESFARAAHISAQIGETRRAAASSRLRDAQLAICGIDRLPHLSWQLERMSGTLSDREAGIARLAARGLTNREIAERLVLSVRTVETHLQRVYKKIGIRTRAELETALRIDD